MATNADSIAELTQAIVDFCRARDWHNDERSLAISVSVEAAELLEHFQFPTYNLRPDQDDIASEVADVFIYLAEFCRIKDINLGEAVLKKLEKQAVKYPIGQSAEQHYHNKLAQRGRLKPETS